MTENLYPTDVPDTQMRTQTEQVELLQALGKDLHKTHKLFSTVVIRIGDVPALRVDGAEGYEVVIAHGDYDLWDGEGLLIPDLSREDMLAKLVELSGKKAS